LDSDHSLTPKTSLLVPNSARRASWGNSHHKAPTYMQTVMSLQSPDTPHSNTSPSPTYTSLPSPRQTSFGKPPTAYKAEDLEAQQISALSDDAPLERTNLYPNVPPEIHRGASIRWGASLRRSNSMDSASIYSSASAAIDAHENMFYPMAFEPAPSSAPAWTTHPNDLQFQQSEARFSRRIPPTIREEPASEAYGTSQVQWKSQAQQKPRLQWKGQHARNHSRTTSESSAVLQEPRVPEHIFAFPVIRPPPAVLQSNPNPLPSKLVPYRSNQSESPAGVASPVVSPGIERSIAPVSSIPLIIHHSGQSQKQRKNALPSLKLVIPPLPPPTSPLPELPPQSPARPTVAGEVTRER